MFLAFFRIGCTLPIKALYSSHGVDLSELGGEGMSVRVSRLDVVVLGGHTTLTSLSRTGFGSWGSVENGAL